MNDARKRTFSETDPSSLDFSERSAPALQKYAPDPSMMKSPLEMSTGPNGGDHDLGIAVAVPGTPDSTWPGKPLGKGGEEHLNSFFSKINPTLPLYASRESFDFLLTFATPPLKDAYMFALGAAAGTDEKIQGVATRGDCATTVEGFFAGSFGPLKAPLEERSWQGNLVYLQILLLLIVYVESRGPHGTSQDYLDSWNEANLLKQAAMVAYYLKLRYLVKKEELKGAEGAQPLNERDRAMIFGAAIIGMPSGKESQSCSGRSSLRWSGRMMTKPFWETTSTVSSVCALHLSRTYMVFAVVA